MNFGMAATHSGRVLFSLLTGKNPLKQFNWRWGIRTGMQVQLLRLMGDRGSPLKTKGIVILKPMPLGVCTKRGGGKEGKGGPLGTTVLSPSLHLFFFSHIFFYLKEVGSLATIINLF